jgi:hypothetical protein
VFYEHEPWGYEIEEQRHAQSLITAVNCIPRGKGTKALDWREFYCDPWTGELNSNRFTPEQLEFLKKRKARNQSRKGK